TITGKVTGSGGLVEVGPQANSNSLLLSPTTANDYSGGTVLADGILFLTSNNSPLGTGPLTLVGGGANFGTLQANANITLSNPLTLDNATPPSNQNAAIAGVSPFTFSGPVVLTGLNTIAGNDSAPVTITGPMSGTGAFIKSGTGTLVLAGTDSSTGAVM